MFALISPGLSISKPALSDKPRHASHSTAWCLSRILDAYDLADVSGDHPLAFLQASFSLFCVPHNLSEYALSLFHTDTDHAAFSILHRYVRQSFFISWFDGTPGLGNNRD